MERLPYIDQHARQIAADRARTWDALLQVMCTDPTDPTTVPTGFQLESAVPQQRLALKGRHWFSRYRLIFTLDDAPHGTVVSAQSWAAFPGPHGRIYKALVIGTRLHVLAVGYLLRRVATESDRLAAA